MTADNTDDIYGVLGREWWEKTGEEVKATPQQVKFAAARFTGSSRSKAAQLAGYAGDAQALRSAGSRADDTDTVKNLLTLALAAAAGLGGVNPVMVREAKEKVGRLVRSLDATIALKAADLFVKLQQAEKERGEAPEDDGFSEWRFCRDLLRSRENGASVFMLLYKSMYDGMGHPANYPLLHDVWNLAQQEPFGKQIWDWCCQNLSPQMRECLQERLGDPKWQLEARIQIWKEIGVDITKMTRAA